MALHRFAAAIGVAALMLFGCARQPADSQAVSPAPSPMPAAAGTSPASPLKPVPSTRSSLEHPRGSGPILPTKLRGQDIERIPTTAKVVALTFDAGANADGLASILATLNAKGVRATFFLTGNFATTYPAKAAQIAAAGHRLGNHTVNHPHLPAQTDAQVLAQLTGAEQSIKAATGTGARPLFRFPYGDRTAHTIAVVNSAGYAAVRWTVDTLGWKGTDPGGQTAQTVLQRVVNAATPGEIVLMHVGSNPDDHTTLDADALPSVIDALRAKGYSFVTLTALF